MTDRQLYILDQHHLGNLTEAERQEFQQFLQDPTFAEQAKFNKQLRPALAKRQAMVFRQKLTKWDAEVARKRRLKMLIIGILLLAGLTIGLHLARNHYESTPIHEDDVYLAYLKPYKNVLLPLVRSEVDSTALEKAMRAYESTRYTEALQFFNDENINQQNESVIFYKAVSQILSKRDNEAQVNFNSLLDSENYGVPSRWYIMLLALKHEDYKETSRHLTLLTAQTSYPTIARESNQIKQWLDKTLKSSR